MLAGLFEAARLMPGALSAPDGSLPLTLISGFLGAGKTTLLNRLLADPQGRRLAVLVNDFGRINIDAELVRARTDDMISLANGCVCCTVSSDLTRTLIDLAQRPDPPQAIVLEASGLADPRGIAQVALSNPALRLDGVLTLVDALSHAELMQSEAAPIPCGAASAPSPSAAVQDEALRDQAAQDPEVIASIARQLDAADLIVLTKTDLLDRDTAQAVRDELHRHWPQTPVMEAIDGQLPASLVLGLDSQRDLRSGPPTPWLHSQAFESWVLQSQTPLEESRLRAFLADLAPRLLRAKGVIHLRGKPGQRHIYQQVGRRASLEPENGANPEVNFHVNRDVDRDVDPGANTLGTHHTGALAGSSSHPGASSIVLIGRRGALDAHQLQSNFEQLRAAR